MPLTFEDQALQTNETFKTFDNVDSLAKSYLDLHSRTSSGSLDLLPEDMRKDPAISRYKNISELARGLVETQKMVGSIEKPPAQATDYKWTKVDGLNEKIKVDEIQKELMAIAHGAGLGNKAADVFQQGILKNLSAKMVAQEQARKDAANKAETALRQEWGANYEATFDRVMKILGPEAGNDTTAVSAALKGSPVLLKRLGKLASLLSEDSLKQMGEAGPAPINDAAGAQKEIDKYSKEITAKGASHPYFNDKDPGHEEAKKKMHDLFALLGK